ncbi:MAG: hypothetical protein RL757_2809 [Bacteroidota bacterium]|jgi:hypothetical protein
MAVFFYKMSVKKEFLTLKLAWNRICNIISINKNSWQQLFLTTLKNIKFLNILNF